MTPGDLVVIEWVDAVGPLDLDPSDRLPLEPMRTCGWVREVTATYVTLHPEEYVAQPGHVRAATSIGLSYITSTRIVEPVGFRPGKPRGPHISDESWGALQRGGDS